MNTKHKGRKDKTQLRITVLYSYQNVNNQVFYKVTNSHLKYSKRFIT